MQQWDKASYVPLVSLSAKGEDENEAKWREYTMPFGSWTGSQKVHNVSYWNYDIVALHIASLDKWAWGNMQCKIKKRVAIFKERFALPAKPCKPRCSQLWKSQKKKNIPLASS